MPHGGEGRAQMRWKHAELALLRKWLKGVSHNPSQKEITRQLEKWQMSGELRAGWTYAKLRSKCTVEAQSAATPLAGKLLQQEPTFTWASAGAARQKALAATFKLSKRGLGSLFAKLEVGAVSQGVPAVGAAAGEAAALGLVGAGAARRGGATAASASPAGEPVPAHTSAPPAVAEGHKLTCDRCNAIGAKPPPHPWMAGARARQGSGAGCRHRCRRWTASSRKKGGAPWRRAQPAAADAPPSVAARPSADTGKAPLPSTRMRAAWRLLPGRRSAMQAPTE